ncbi:protein of unknown function [Shewanella benthica]|uniref:Lipoprotein n=1 Tax=Shewanella benthica TaxID=43661 RepID=A0A330M9Q8_9GAMM|nr:protein of unknown function [Shewanella benthica]
MKKSPILLLALLLGCEDSNSLSQFEPVYVSEHVTTNTEQPVETLESNGYKIKTKFTTSDMNVETKSNNYTIKTGY